MFTLDTKVAKNTTDHLRGYEIDHSLGGNRWKPVHHKELADTYNNILMNHPQIRVNSYHWQQHGKGNHELTGNYVLDVLDNQAQSLNVLSGELDLTLSVLHSNSQRHPLTNIVGASVLVCSNGMMVHNTFDKVKRKHTLNMSVYAEVNRAVDLYIDRVQSVQDTVIEMKETEVNDRQLNDVLVSSGKRGIIAWSGLGKVLNEYEHPKHPEFKPRTVWSLYNAYTEVAKEMSIPNQARTIGGVRWSLADAGLMPLPDYAQFS